MSTKKFNEWLEAARILGEDPDKKVLCPKCNIGHLQIEDVMLEEEKKCVRHLLCPSCREYIVFTFFID